MRNGKLTTARADGSTRRERVVQKETAILSAAREVFIELGFERAKIAEIARRAGVAEGTIYLYYKTKNDLMRAVVLEFWNRITKEAAKAINPGADTFDQLRALARHHLTMMMRDRDYIDLEVILRNSGTDPIARDRSMVKRYVAIFDGVFRSGQTRGELDPKARIWMARDLFYGSLDYSARTIALRGAKRPTGVVDNLIATFSARYNLVSTDAGKPPASLVERLESAVEKIERVTRK